MAHLITLPLPILEGICEYLEFSDTHRKSLSAFSLTSRHCCSAATKVRFRRIRIKFKNQAELHCSIKKWVGILAFHGATNYVRCVHVLGQISEVRQQTDTSRPQVWAGIGDTFLNPPDGPGWLNHDKGNDGSGEVENIAWQPLADLLVDLSNVQDFIYASNDQIAPCVLAALHQHHPRSRLHVHNFHLRSLTYPWESPQNISSHDLALASSPCLYSIYLYWNPCLKGKRDCNAEGVRALVAHCAPNLKHTWVFKEEHVTTGFLHPELAEKVNDLIRRQPWQGFQPGQQIDVPESRGRLETLILDGDGRLHKSLDVWGGITDLNVLKSIELLTNTSPEILANFANLAKMGKFRSLSSLGLRMRLTFADRDTQILRREMDQATSSLLEHLPPLEAISIYEFIGDATLQAISSWHGDRLLRLCLDMTPRCISKDQIKKLKDSCPALKQLKIPIFRTQGQGEEIEIYRLLSQFPQMESLTIQYWVAPPRSRARTRLHGRETFEQRSHCAKEYLINSAMDSRLARSIFRTVASSADAQLSSAPGWQPKLQYLALEPRGTQLAVNCDDSAGASTMMRKVMTWLARSCVCEWGRWDVGDADNISVREKVHGNISFCKLAFRKMAENADATDKAWRGLWPVEESGDRMNSWSSLPLATA